MLSYHRFEGPPRWMLAAAFTPLLVLLLAVPSNWLGAGLATAIVTLALVPPFLMGVFVRLHAGHVIVGCMPVYWVRMPVEAVHDVQVVEVRPWEDYGGWGVKGSAHTPTGLLFSAGGSEAVSLATTDGRHYLVSAKDCKAVAGQLRDTLVREPLPSDRKSR